MSMALIRALKGSWDELLESVCSAVTTDVPAALLLGPDELRNAADWTGRLYAGALVGQDLPEFSLAELAVRGASVARRGVPLDVLDEIMDSALDAAVEHVDGLIAGMHIKHVDDLRTFVRTVMTRIHRTDRQVRAALVAGRDLAADEAVGEARRTASLVEKLLDGSQDVEWPSLEAELGSLGFAGDSLMWGVVILVARHGADSSTTRAAAQHVAATLANALEGPAAHKPLAHALLLVSADDANKWEQQAQAVQQSAGGHPVLVLASAVARPLRQVRDLYEACSRDLAYARLSPDPSGRIDPAALALSALLAEGTEAKRARMFDVTLGPLVADPSCGEYLDLLEILATTDSQIAASELLGRDPTTIRRHLRTIHEITGYKWADVRHRLFISVALLCRRMAAQSVIDWDPAVWGPAPRAPRDGDSA
jgi:sugar diacid utilization regulator